MFFDKLTELLFRMRLYRGVKHDRFYFWFENRKPVFFDLMSTHDSIKKPFADYCRKTSLLLRVNRNSDVFFANRRHLDAYLEVIDAVKTHFHFAKDGVTITKWMPFGNDSQVYVRTRAIPAKHPVLDWIQENDIPYQVIDSFDNAIVFYRNSDVVDLMLRFEVVGDGGNRTILTCADE